jgi:hypothetical protein
MRCNSPSQKIAHVRSIPHCGLQLVAGGSAPFDFAGLLLTSGALDLGVDLLPQFAARPTFGDGKPVQEIGLAQPGQVGVDPPPLQHFPAASVDPTEARIVPAESRLDRPRIPS